MATRQQATGDVPGTGNEEGAPAWVAERDAVFDAMVDGVCVFDATGGVVRINSAFRALIGLKPGHESEYAGRNLLDRATHLALRDEDGLPLAPDELPVARILRGEVLSGGRLVVLVRAADGRDILLGLSGSPLRDPAGCIRGGVLICRDITEQRRLQARTRDALQALLEMANVLVQGPPAGASVDTARHFGPLEAVATQLAALASGLLGCRDINLLGVTTDGEVRPIAQVGLRPEEEHVWRKRAAERRLVPDPVLYAAILTRMANGENVIVDTSVPPYDIMANPFDFRTYLLSPMRVGSTLVGMLTVAYRGEAHAFTQDEVALAEAVARLAGLAIEREQLQREREEARAGELALRAANQRMEEFLSLAAHEMRTPLTTITGYLQLAQRRLAPTEAEMPPVDAARRMEAARGVLQRTDEGLNRLTRLVGDLVDAAQLGDEGFALHLKPLNLTDLVRAAIEDRRSVAPGRVIVVEAPPAPEVRVLVDADRLQRVVSSYLANALAYSAQDQPVTVGIAVERDAALARVWVRDYGPGLPKAEQGRIWERFYRVQGLERRAGSQIGLGLGLHISRAIVERHGGTVGVDSIPGAGATFWFSIPLAPSV